MNILFVCTANKDRSKTAEIYFISRASSEYNFRSAGTSKYYCDKEASQYLNEEHLSWADVVFVMEQKHQDQIKERFGEKYNQKITQLNISDHYEFMSESLITVLKDKLEGKIIMS